MQLGGGIVCPACACGCGSVSEMCNSWKWSRKFFLLTILGFRNSKFCFIDHRSKIWGLTVLFNRNEIKSSSYLGMKRKCDFCAFMRVISTKWVELILDHLFGMYSDSLRMRSFASPIASPSWWGWVLVSSIASVSLTPLLALPTAETFVIKDGRVVLLCDAPSREYLKTLYKKAGVTLVSNLTLLLERLYLLRQAVGSYK